MIYNHSPKAAAQYIARLGAFAAGILFCLSADASIKEGGPDALADTCSLGCLIQQSADRPVHIIFVHGMRATGEGASATFREGLCKHVSGGCRLQEGAPPRGVRSPRFNLGRYPSDANIVDRKIWETEASWLASRPFVDRFVYLRPTGAPIVVDEVNWWPLLFPTKCRFLLVPEANLSGPDKDDLKLCARSDDVYYPWIDAQELNNSTTGRAKSGGGAIINSALKQQIMDWGLSDAVMTVGPMQRYFRRAMSAAFDYAANFDGKSIDQQEFVVVSESLGSFAVLDAFATPEPAFVSSDNVTQPASSGVHDVLTRTYYLYFFANQFAMLELARVEGLERERKGRDSAASSPTPSASPLRALGTWAHEKSQRPNHVESERAGKYAQIIAFSDPSDMLTFDVPAIANTKVVNLYDRNSFSFFGLFESPSSAHAGHSSNPDVLKTMFGK